MSATELGLYIRRVRLAPDVATLSRIAGEVRARYPADEATPALLHAISAKAKRLAGDN